MRRRSARSPGPGNELDTALEPRYAVTPRRIGSLGTTAAVRKPLAQMVSTNTARKAVHSPALSEPIALLTVARSRSS